MSGREDAWGYITIPAPACDLSDEMRDAADDADLVGGDETELGRWLRVVADRLPAALPVVADTTAGEAIARADAEFIATALDRAARDYLQRPLETIERGRVGEDMMWRASTVRSIAAARSGGAQDDGLREALRIHHPIMRSETGPFSGCRCGQVRLGQDVIAHVVTELRAALDGAR